MDVPVKFNLSDFKEKANKKVDALTEDRAKAIDHRLRALVEHDEWKDYTEFVEGRIASLKALIDPESGESIVEGGDTPEIIGIKFQAVMFAVNQLRVTVDIPRFVKTVLDDQDDADKQADK